MGSLVVTLLNHGRFVPVGRHGLDRLSSPRGNDCSVFQDASKLCAWCASVFCDCHAIAGLRCSLLVKSNDGRPTKVEGNPDLSFGKGGTDAFTQASLLNLYDPDRSKKYLKEGNASTRSAALGGLRSISAKFKGNKW
jgi:anaerobic selenocysteine-containing dehydrogenase